MTQDRNSQSQRVVAYLQRSLQRNPVYDSERIIHSRNVALGLKKPKPPTDAEASTRQREKLRPVIDSVRAACWTKPVEPLIQQLRKLPLDGHPDLQRAAQRLRTILSHRNRLPQLAAHRHFDEKFLACFKQILTEPPREQAIPREQVIASFRNRKLRRRGMKMIQLLEREVPELCQLEQDWLDSLKRQKVNRDWIVKANDQQTVSNESSGISWWLVWVIIFITIKILAALARNSG